ncbi:hemolysin family protein [Terriglobus aquaticus]|uniref:Hemolysin family protein n=1 Tax=Terriglobus aquaticus TaxID=940139 RepID=A0ABW9KP32_9BACT|nr:hemolysin family protein [Terriglobus aquaticus]
MLDWALFRLFTVAVLILANAFFVAAEFAVVSVRETRLEQMLAYNRVGAAAALRLKREIDDFLAANQLGVTLCSLALGWVGEQGVAEVLVQLLHRWHWFAHNAWLQQHTAALSHTLASVLAFTIITFLEVVLGEQVPKSLSLQKAERIALAIAGPMDIFIRLVRPAVRLLKRSTGLVLRLFRAPLRPETAEVHSPEEIKLIASATRSSGLLPEFQERLIHHAIDSEHVTVREIMTPRGRMFCLPSDMPVDLASARIVEEQHSRIPVYDPALGVEHIQGIVYSKDISRLMQLRRTLPAAYAGTGNLQSIMREALLVPETKSTAEVLQEFQRTRRQIAIVVDEFGSTVGLVTAEDALEQIVGEMDDEFDVQARGLAGAVGDRRVVDLDGTVPLRDLVTQLHWKIPRESGIETLAGFVLAQLGHLPAKGETFVRGSRRFTVLERDGRRISRVRVEHLESAAPVEHNRGAALA